MNVPVPVLIRPRRVVVLVLLVTLRVRDLVEVVVVVCLDQVGVQAIGAFVVDDVDASLRPGPTGRGAARSDWSPEAGGWTVETGSTLQFSVEPYWEFN